MLHDCWWLVCLLRGGVDICFTLSWVCLGSLPVVGWFVFLVGLLFCLFGFVNSVDFCDSFIEVFCLLVNCLIGLFSFLCSLVICGLGVLLVS